jgi:hypothetical protein
MVKIMYDYREAMKEDIKEYLKNDAELSTEDIIYMSDDTRDSLYDDLWTEDSVTGNGSGSYTFNSYKAGEYVKDNIDLCREALQEFCVDADTIAEKFLEEEWEYFDVTIRCYLLGECLDSAIEELKDELEEESEEE